MSVSYFRLVIWGFHIWISFLYHHKFKFISSWYHFLSKFYFLLKSYLEIKSMELTPPPLVENFHTFFFFWMLPLVYFTTSYPCLLNKGNMTIFHKWTKWITSEHHKLPIAIVVFNIVVNDKSQNFLILFWFSINFDDFYNRLCWPLVDM